MSIVTIVVFIIILAVLVLVHEFGHFLAAKKCGVLVEEFGFGFPPRVWGKKIGDTLYSINALPIGGFVKLFGEEYHEDAQDNLHDSLKNVAFIYKKPWQKSFIVVAGIIGNFLLAWVLISFLFTQGVPSPTNTVIIDTVSKGSPAEMSGLKTNDVIQSLRTPDGKTIILKSTADLIDSSKKYTDKPLLLTVLSDKTIKKISISPRSHPPVGQGPLGISITTFKEKKYPWYSAPFFGLAEAFKITGSIASELGKTVYSLVTTRTSKVDVAGPIGIAQYTGQAIKFGNNAVLELVALLSLNLAVVNILPFPALDGGRLVFIVYEWITKRRVNKKVEQYVNMSGMAILLGAAALITVHDILKLIHK